MYSSSCVWPMVEPVVPPSLPPLECIIYNKSIIYSIRNQLAYQGARKIDEKWQVRIFRLGHRDAMSNVEK